MNAAAGTPLVSVVVCTHNRATDARRCVSAVAAQAAALGWELLVVDSASSAIHAQALAMLPRHFPGLKLLRLDAAGLSTARNRGADMARGTWVGYLDDDAIARPDWAPRLDAALRALPASVAMVGGRIEALWPAGQRSSHVSARWLLMLSCVDTAVPGRVADGSNVCGANFAVRRDALRAVGGFPIELGRVGGRLISGEESFVIRRLEHLGLDTVYEPGFAVQHCIEAKRLTRPWIAQRAYWEGVTRVVQHRALHEPMPRTLSLVKLAASIPLLWALRWLRAADPDYLIRLHMARGSLHARLQRGAPLGTAGR
jgi:glucosyl-dolichyl phosphate glucuronosyltransferase